MAAQELQYKQGGGQSGKLLQLTNIYINIIMRDYNDKIYVGSMCYQQK